MKPTVTLSTSTFFWLSTLALVGGITVLYGIAAFLGIAPRWS